MPASISQNNHQFDVVVVGCGVAGLSAAVAAAEAGARVAVLERSTYDERGGNTRYTTAALRMESEHAVSGDFVQRFLDNCGYHVDPEFAASTVLDYANWPGLVRALPFTDPELISFFAEGVPPAIAWLKAHGVKFGGIGFYGLTPRASPRIAITGGGLHLIEVMTAHAEKIGARFFYETTAQSLLQTDEGVVCGLRANSKTGARQFNCRAVILACGGFQGNLEMVVRYIGVKGRYLRPVARGGYYDKGEGIAMALHIGAAPAGDFAEYHAEPIDPRSSATEPLVMAYPYGILINQQGERFTDEAPGPIDASYEDTTRLIAAQTQGIAFCILDDKINAIENWQRCVRTDQPPVIAPDIATLARTLGFAGAAAQRTIEAYNRACAKGGAFNPRALDGLATTGLSPAKSNYAVPLDTPPYHAYPIISSNTFTFGGLKVNGNAQVINTDGDAMPGLYAAGETVGLYYGKYPGATSVLRGAVFGRRAGEHAASPTAGLQAVS